MGNATSLECCTKREAIDEEPPWQLDRHYSWQSIPEAEEFLQFLDCEEGPWPETPNSKKAKLLRHGTFEIVRSIPEETDEPVRSASSAARTKAQLEEDAKYEDKVDPVTERVREAWKQRQDAALDEDCTGAADVESIQAAPELNEWTEELVVRRMLRAAAGNEDQAVQTLLKAIECRVQDRQLYKKLRCEVVCDARIIGRDLEQRPVVYFCAYSQKAPLSEMVPQLCLAMEAAVMLSKLDGQVALVVDMYKFKTSINMDIVAIKKLGDTFSSIFAERLNLIMIVDFSLLAQGIWSMIKPSLSEKTRRKINFVNEAKAREAIQARFPQATRDRILASFDINRDKLSTPEDREEHARRTSICNVPISPDQHAADIMVR